MASPMSTTPLGPNSVQYQMETSPIPIIDIPESQSQKKATVLIPNFSAILPANSWSQSAGIAIKARRIYAVFSDHIFARNSIKKVEANVSQNQKIKTRDIVQYIMR